MFDYQPQKTQCVASFAGELTIYCAAEVKAALLGVLDDPRELIIDLARVSELDSAGIQLLMLAKKHRTGKNLALHLVHHSQPVLDAFQLLDLVSYFNDPIVLTDDVVITKSQRSRS